MATIQTALMTTSNPITAWIMPDFACPSSQTCERSLLHILLISGSFK
ncbi:MAG: hypothetical protein ABIH11_04060 [Candidatus Altiarchaeota archaeon]